MKFIHTTQTVVNRIKAAGKLLRNTFDSLGHANDAAAVNAGYESYHHVRWCLEQTKAQGKRIVPQGVEAVVSAALRLIPGFLRLDPAVDLESEDSRRAAANAGPRACAKEIKQIQLEGGEAYFTQASKDFAAFNAGWVTPKEQHLTNQMEVAQAVWKALLLPEHQGLYEQLHLYGVLKTTACYLRGLQDFTVGSEKWMTNRLLANLLIDIMNARTDREARNVLMGAGSWALLPRSMNINVHSGAEDYESPSTYWSRSSAGVSLCMIGTVAALPFAQIKSLPMDAEVPLTPLLVPGDTRSRKVFMGAAKERWERLVAQ